MAKMKKNLVDINETTTLARYASCTDDLTFVAATVGLACRDVCAIHSAPTFGFDAPLGGGSG